MAANFKKINELAAENAVPLVKVTNPNAHDSAIANGALVTSEVICRTLGRLGIPLPDNFLAELEREFVTAEAEERTTVERYHRDTADRRFEVF